MLALALLYVVDEQRSREGAAAGAPNVSATAASIRVSDRQFGRCGAPPHADCVVDGDTFYFRDISIRLSGIDAPEINPPECAREADLGARASLRLMELLNSGPFELVRAGAEDEDQYGRKLRFAVREGERFGDILEREGLARAWAGRHLSWCE